MQQEARGIAHNIARVDCGLPPLLDDDDNKTGDFGFYYDLTDVVRWYTYLERYNFLPDPGHVSEQDWRKMVDVGTFRRLVNEEREFVREEKEWGRSG
jgi:hypothetical protein